MTMHIGNQGNTGLRSRAGGKHRRVGAAIFVLLSIGWTACAVAQPGGNLERRMSGDDPANPGPLAHLSPSLRPQAVRTAMRKVADWQLARVQNQWSQGWTYATLYIGMLSASQTLHDQRYSDFVRREDQHYNWTLGPRKIHADDQIIGQSYLWFYRRDHDPRQIAQMRAQFDDVSKIPDDPDKPVWWWCDALFMAPPTWTELAAVTHDNTYTDYMDREWRITSNLLWDKQEHLFFRDATFFSQREKNGQKVFWSRGNGWVIAGIARVLAFLPANDPRRPFYVEKFRQMAAKLKSLQGSDGLWRPGLLDAADYPYPENSGSAFFVYAMAWGVRNGILDANQYRPVVAHGWRGLVAHIYQDGRLGSMQPIGSAPGKYGPGAGYVYGTGAFLMAGSEIVEMDRAKHVQVAK
ncbi:MAG TPA: glycoside hydrolase family 88 protein [Terracidiphilus sp.]|nr:glycoside hydrolase family 88 protein [Terracidiphilus sp.]